MKKHLLRILSFALLVFLQACCPSKNSTITVWIIGDSTVADYTLYDNYETERYPVTGWGQVFQQFMNGAYRDSLQNLLKADSVIVDDRAKGGRSTRTFFQEGRWREVYEALKPGDFVLMQFGHNDGAENKPERYVDPDGYKEFLRLFILQSQQKGAKPVLITPVARNFPWKDSVLTNVHGVYPDCVKEIANETGTPLIDLNEMSMQLFTQKGKEYVTTNYFMNLPAGEYVAYPDGQHDNTHFQPKGAKEVAKLVYKGLHEISNQLN